jgi:hypothetical protein
LQPFFGGFFIPHFASEPMEREGLASLSLADPVWGETNSNHQWLAAIFGGFFIPHFASEPMEQEGLASLSLADPVWGEIKQQAPMACSHFRRFFYSALCKRTYGM